MSIVHLYRPQFHANTQSGPEVTQSASLHFGPAAAYAYITIAGVLSWATPAEAQTALSGYTVRQSDGTDRFVDLSKDSLVVLSISDQVTSVSYVAVAFQANCMAIAHAEAWS